MIATRKIICLVLVVNWNDTYRFSNYVFKYDKNCQPIPVEVPEDIAKLLLQMMDRSCRCRYKKPKPMFKDIT